MRAASLGIVALAAATAACPRSDFLLGNRGIAIAGGGGSGAHVLAFTVQPSGATAGNIITPAIQVTVKDSLGNPDTSFTATVTIRTGSNPVGGTLSGTTAVAPANGVAVFGDLSLDKAGAGYTLKASAPGATSATSNSFTITGP